MPVYPSAGFDGIKGKREFADRALGRPPGVLHVGDRDDHGDRINVAAAEDAIAWAGNGEVVDVQAPGTPGLLTDPARQAGRRGPGLRFVRLALTTTQADDLGLLDADGKAEADASMRASRHLCAARV